MTYSVRTLLKDEHIQQLEDEFRETRLVWDVIGISEVRRPEGCFTTLQSGHLLYKAATYCTKANNGQAGVGFLINRKWKEGKQHQPQSSRTCSVHIKVLQTKDSASICTNNIIPRRRHK